MTLSTYGGEFVFANGVTGSTNKFELACCTGFTNTETVDPKKVMLHFPNEGAMMITVDPGFRQVLYNPAQAQ